MMRVAHPFAPFTKVRKPAADQLTFSLVGCHPEEGDSPLRDLTSMQPGNTVPKVVYAPYISGHPKRLFGQSLVRNTTDVEPRIPTLCKNRKGWAPAHP